MIAEWKPEWGYQLRPVPWWAPTRLWLVSERIKHVAAQVDPAEIRKAKQLPSLRLRIEALKMLMADASFIHHCTTGCPICGSCFGAKPE